MSETESNVALAPGSGTEIEPAPEAELDEIPGTFGVQVHPDPRQYVFIGLVLVVITAFEVAISYSESLIGPNFIIGILAAAAIVKIILVCGWYMHMKQDRPFFRRLFMVGIVGATIVYGIVILMFSSSVLSRIYS